MEIIIPLLIILVFAYIFYDMAIGQYKTTITKEKCTCGQEKKWCASYLYSGGSVLLGRKNMFSCKKNQDNFKKLVDSPEIQRIMKEINEQGYSCPSKWNHGKDM